MEYKLINYWLIIFITMLRKKMPTDQRRVKSPLVGKDCEFLCTPCLPGYKLYVL